MEPVPETRQVLDEMRQFGDQDAEDALRELARSAQDIVPQCVGLSLGLLTQGLTFTLVATAEEIAVFDTVQYLDGGPCIAAAHQGEVIDVERAEMLDERQWRMYAQATAAAGVRSSLTLPLEAGGRVVGSVNLYASTEEAFVGHHEELAAALGASATSAVANADLSFSTRLLAAEAPLGLSDQDDISMAQGAIAASQGVDITIARERLRQAAARGGITEAQAARALRALLFT
jgi:GAF domain-containing protein